MGEIRLTHLQQRRLRQLDAIFRGQRRHDGVWITSHWSASRGANQRLCEHGLAARHGETFHQPSGKPADLGEVRITAAGIAWLNELDTRP